MMSKHSMNILPAIAVACILTLLVGCSGNLGKGNTEAQPADLERQEQAPLEPVTLRIHISTTYGEDDFFQDVFVNPVKAKYPHITLERVLPQQGESHEILAASGNIPDLLVDGVGNIMLRHDLGLNMDLTALAKKHQSDLTRFRPVVLDAHRSSDGKELYGIPWNGNFNALYYNKDLFDKFGVAYPHDGMMWSDAVELSRRLTRTDGGVQYHGYDMDSMHRITFPLSITAIDAQTNQAKVNTDGWRTAFTLGQQIYTIPGGPPVFSAGINRFMKDRTTAMLGTINLIYRLIGEEGQGLNWDVVQYPSYPERPNTFGRVDVHSLQISPTSKYKDEAFLVADLIGSREVQLKLVRKHARYALLDDPRNEIMNQFGADIPELKGKNVANIFRSTYAPFTIAHKQENAAFRIVTNKFLEMIGGKDMNTALREAEEEINKLPLKD